MIMNKKPLRIALFTGLYAPFLTGVSVAVHQRVHWLLKQGHEVFLIHPEINDQYPPQVGKRPMSGIEELETFINSVNMIYQNIKAKPCLEEF